MGKWIGEQQIMLEQEMIEAKAKQMSDDIDREVLWGMLQGIGWSRVILSQFIDNNHAIDITYWLKDNCKHAYERHGSDFMFESAKDANWFKLRWVS